MIDGIWKSMDIVIVVIQIVGFSGETQQPSLYVGPSDAMKQTIGFKELPTENEGFTMDLRTIQLQGFPVTFLFNTVDCRTDHSGL